MDLPTNVYEMRSPAKLTGLVFGFGAPPRCWGITSKSWFMPTGPSMYDVRNGSKEGVSLALSASYGVTSHYLAFVERRDAILAASS
jgi:hypothetical protein